MNTAVNWFEIPATNFERAVKFYGQVFQRKLTVLDLEERKMALLPPGADPAGEVDPGGSILQVADFEPSEKGPIVYLDPIDELDVVMGRVQEAGGRIDTPKTRIGHGYLATFLDSEGNIVGLLEWDKA